VTTTPERLAAALAGRYRIERELGAGGMATVWLAHDLKHERKVAIKVLHPHLAAVVGAERFLKEIKTTANLQHPHILALHDSGDVDGLLFYVMPFVDGESLRQRIIRDHQLPVADAVRIASEVAGALDYAHRQGVVHRDIKPENILLHEGSALVADFGIALAPVTGDIRLTETGMSLGTPHYMSPGQALGDRELDARTDIYAVGAMLYETLTGKPPFTGPSAQAIVAKVLTEKPVPPSRLRRETPVQVEKSVLRALQKKPEDRFASAAAFQSALSGQTPVPRQGQQSNQRAIWMLGLVGALAIAAVMLNPWRHQPRVIPRHVADTAASRLFAVAVEAAKRRDPANCDRAIQFFSQAVEKDSMYADAWGGLAKANALCALFGSGDPAVSFTAARVASQRALSLDSTLPGAYVASGMVHLFREQQWAEAQHDFTQAIAHDSTQYEAWLFRTWYYFAVNQLDSAVRSMRRAKLLAPTEPIVGVRLATALRYAGHPADAQREISEVASQYPGNPMAVAEQFEFDAHYKHCTELRNNAPVMEHNPMAYNRALAAYGHAICGDRPRAQFVADSVDQLVADGKYVDLFGLAVVHAGLGDSDMVLHTLDQAVSTHAWALFFVGQFFAFQPYHGNPKFEDLKKRANIN